jgi:hypothetical protein
MKTLAVPAPVAPVKRPANQEIPQPRKMILADISITPERLLARTASEGENYRQLILLLGLLASVTGQTNAPIKRVYLMRLAAHCVGWVEQLQPRVSVFAFIHHERRRQTQLFMDGELPFNCAAPDVDEKLKLQVVGEEAGEVAQALDDLRGAHLLKTAGRTRSEIINLRTLELCAEITQVSAVCVAWLESLEGGAR